MLVAARPSRADLAAYRPVWSVPQHGTFHGFDIHSLGAHDAGGARLIEALHLVEEARLGDPTTSWEALYWLIQISRQGDLQWKVPADRRVTRRHARQVWRQMRARQVWRRMRARQVWRRMQGVLGLGRAQPESHSDYVLVVNGAGNVAAACQSINTNMWGTTGLFVGGISIPDAATHRQYTLRDLKPGANVPSMTNPTIVTRGTRPVLASSSVGGGLSAVTLQCLVAILRSWPGYRGSGQAAIVPRS